MPTLTLKTPAKINLFLNIRGQRPDGYHELCMVMQTLSLFDTLTFEPNLQRAGLVFKMVQNEQGRLLRQEALDQNLIVRAYRHFWRFVQLTPMGLTVTLDKQIPIQAGLGGGSSNAAAMLLVLNHLSHAGLSLHELQRLGAELGADVPFFLTGGVALAMGRGEQVEPLSLDTANGQVLRRAWVIVKPRHWGIPTPQAYQAVRQAGRYQTQTPEHLILALRSAIQNPLADEPFEHYLLNDFEPVLLSQYPILQRMADGMRSVGIRRPLLCGSGSAMAGLLPMTMQYQRAVAQVFPEADYAVYWTFPHWGGPVQVGTPLSSVQVTPVHAWR